VSGTLALATAILGTVGIHLGFIQDPVRHFLEEWLAVIESRKKKIGITASVSSCPQPPIKTPACKNAKKIGKETQENTMFYLINAHPLCAIA
jgi:hypothetical protein